jgi:hypothetical protein
VITKYLNLLVRRNWPRVGSPAKAFITNWASAGAVDLEFAYEPGGREFESLRAHHNQHLTNFVHQKFESE